MKSVCGLDAYTHLVHNCVKMRAYQGECSNCALSGLCEVEQSGEIWDMANMVELEVAKDDGN